MPDEDANQGADAEALPESPLHAYKEGREDEVEGDVEKLKSGDPKQSQQQDVAGDESDSQAHNVAPPKEPPPGVDPPQSSGGGPTPPAQESREGSSQGSGEQPGDHNDNEPPPEGAGQKGAGAETGGLGGLEDGTEPHGKNMRQD